jgi:pSer/pThr/pTyr-binding forkhead associated (FHA) protein
VATHAVPAAKLRGTQMVSMSRALAGLGQRAGTALLDSAAMQAHAAAGPSIGTQALQTSSAPTAGRALTSALPNRTSQLPSRTSQLPSRTSLLPASEPRRTKMLSIGLHAEAPPEPLVAELQGHALPLSGRLCSIGTAPESAIRLNDPAVAFVHAQVAQHGNALYLRDAGTQTGTWVNGVPLAGAHALHDGDRVLVGRTELVFRSSMLGKTSAPSEPVIALPRLELRSGPSMGLSFVLSSDSCSIGSGQGADLQVFEPSVAALHAQVRLIQGVHYLSDVGSASGSYARGVRLMPGQELALGDGEVFQLGAVALAYTRAPTMDRLAAFRPTARLSVASGAGLGQAATFAERLRVGSAPDAELRLPGAAGYELELVLHQGACFVRDLSGGRTFKAGAPLGPEWVQVLGGEMLLISSGALLRFEEA